MSSEVFVTPNTKTSSGESELRECKATRTVEECMSLHMQVNMNASATYDIESKHGYRYRCDVNMYIYML